MEMMKKDLRNNCLIKCWCKPQFKIGDVNSNKFVKEINDEKLI